MGTGISRSEEAVSLGMIVSKLSNLNTLRQHRLFQPHDNLARTNGATPGIIRHLSPASVQTQEVSRRIPKRHLRHSYVARYERYAEEVRRICSLLDIPLPDTLPHRLNTKRHIRPITEAEASAIYRDYEMDFEHFAYDPDGWEAFA